MKRFTINARVSTATGLVCATMLALPSLHAGDNKAPVTENGTTTAEEETTTKNWIELGIGGVNVAGDDAQFKQEHRWSGDVFGGIESMHIERELGKNATLTID